jgi:hypothetical protein
MIAVLVTSPLLLALPPATAQDGRGRAKLQNLVQLPADFVRFARLPEGGLFPRVARGKDELAVLYFQGGEERGDLLVVRSRDEGASFSAPQRVDPEQGTAARVEDLHGGELDVGPDGSVHVVWTTPSDPPALRYARLPAEGEPLAPVDLGAPPGLCLSAAVAVNGAGRIHVFYLAAEGPEDLESVPPERRVWVRRSQDGLEFSPPEPVDRESTGVSEHSAMTAHVDEVMGTLYVLYRTGYALKPDSPSLSRGMRLLHSEDGEAFKSTWVDNWKSVRDPHSNASLGQEDLSTLAVWESGGQVFWSVIRRQAKKMNVPMEPRSDGPAMVRSRPAGAAGSGEVCLAWLERPEADPAAAPKLAWRVWLREGRAPIGDGVAPGAPRCGWPAIFPRAAGGFTVLY